MLEIEDLHVYYGAIHAVKGISLSIPSGKIVTLLGANGAGKSSTVRAISGLIKNPKGKITLNNSTNIIGYEPENIVKLGIALSPEGRKIFPHLSVDENLSLGAYIQQNDKNIKEDRQWVYELFPRLKERAWQKGGTLSGGEQQMLALGRALMSRPKVLMLDEPSLGLAPILVKELFTIIRKVNEMGTTILLIEQNAFAALAIADYAYILETGNIALSGVGKDLLKNPEVKKAYLGG